jgi:TRAP-type C4-dicarboxylate transport system permease small subunit
MGDFMNTTLISLLDSINQILALFIVVAATATGWIFGQPNGSGAIYAVLGLIAGLVTAAVICGLLATLLQIERHLRRIAETRAN